MKRKMYVTIIISTTIISVFTMLYSTYLVNNNVKGFNVIKNDKYEAKKVNEYNISHNDIIFYNKVDDYKIDLENFEDSSNVNNVEIKENKYSNYLEENFNYRYDTSEDYFINDNNISLDEEDESVSVFKVNKNTISDKISNKDKLKLLSMSKKLSFKDYKELLNHIKRSDELPAARDIFLLLKDKLSDNQYNDIKDILNPFIDIDLIEKSIKNK